MFFNSIRWRLQLWHGVLLVAVLAGFGLTAYQLQRTNLLRRIDTELERRIELVGEAMRHNQGPGQRRFGPPGRGPGQDVPPRGPESIDEPAEGFPQPDGRNDGAQDGPPLDPQRHPRPPRAENQGPGPGQIRLSANEQLVFQGGSSNAFYYFVWRRDGVSIGQSDNAPLNAPRPRREAQSRAVRMRRSFREMFWYTPPGECVLAGKDIHPELAELRQVALVLLAAGGAVLAVGLAGGWWLTSRAIRPIRDISITASKIASGDLSQRIPSEATKSELDQLTVVLNSTFARLEASFEQQARFTSDAAHELRTPVSVMLTQTQSALTRDRSGEEYRETLEACQRAAQRMRQLTESLLQLARLDAAEEKMDRKRLDLADITAECVELIRPLATERRLSIHTDLTAAACVGDAHGLAQVVTNLLTNAIHYNKDAGEIRVTVRQDQDAAILTVADTGEGISTENLPHIFDRFWRADQARSRANGRTGLGLAIVKSIVELHGGRVSATSKSGEGSVFEVRLLRD